MWQLSNDYEVARVLMLCDLINLENKTDRKVRNILSTCRGAVASMYSVATNFISAFNNVIRKKHVIFAIALSLD